ncbi:MAG: HEAT repeat domain-containing protein [Planctomycetota bacterium]|nr:HEAT repeat domain-containing protein [Planctomycetota bacterium]
MSNRAAGIRWALSIAGALALMAGGCSSSGSESRAGAPVRSSVTRNVNAAGANAPGVDVLAVRTRAIRVLEQAVRVDDAQVRANAVEAAGFGSPETDRLIVAALRDPNEAVRTVAATTIGRRKITAIGPRVLPLLADPSPYVQVSAIFAAVQTGQTDAGADIDQSPLAAYLFNQESTRLRAHAAWVLGELRNPSARPMLLESARQKLPKAMPGEVRSLQLQIAEALVKVGDQSAVEGLRSALYAARPEDLEGTALAVQILGEVQDRRSIDHMLFLLQYKDRAGQPMPAEVRMGIAIALAKMGVRDGDFIADEYRQHPDPVLRQQAAAVYGYTQSALAPDKLLLLLADPDPLVAVQAAAAILQLDPGQSSPRGSLPTRASTAR